ncbi:YqjF family protein [Microbacterium sp. SLBN-146]|uniref:YqjF family protein n=1 Tax=Microbacterium sp. SLBN-146 TaxID=2768457 RepID=UPI001153E2F8|nr:DUF2071 domain-containing protein [Microbacterium sp. SLBN-146]TQJ30556.1 hypothetical protein FBY39_1009 [Microbacterium sp. SLBN-146]
MPFDRDAPALPGRAVISQTWSSAIFLHWRVDAARVAPLLPPGVRPDIFDGSAWIGLVPFELSRFRFLPLPAVPLVGTFNEINVRTYGIDAEGRRGVVFLTLEAEHLIPVLAARVIFGLPYRWAAIGRRIDRAASAIEYRSRRRDLDGRAAGPGTRIRVAVGDEPVDTELSRFLTARWGFHERHLGRTTWAANEHEPWPLVAGDLLGLDDGLLTDRGFADLARRSPDSILAMPLGHPGFTTRFARPRRA